MAFEHVLAPIEIAGCRLRNRVARSAHVTGLARGGIGEAEGLFLKARVLADELSQEGPSAAAWMGLQLIRRDRGDLLGALRLGRTMIRRFPRSRMTIHAAAHLNLGESCQDAMKG